MWIKQIKKQNSDKGKVFYQYQLTQTSRINGAVKQISVLYLGSNALLQDKENRNIVCRFLQERICGQSNIATELDQAPQYIIKLVEEYYQKYLIKHPEGHQFRVLRKNKVQYEAIDMGSTQVYDTKDIGAEWLTYSILERLNIAEELHRQGWNNESIEHAQISIISRAVAAMSEHKTAQWLHNNSALLELFPERNKNINRHHLYCSASRLYEIKDQLEQYLYDKSVNMFNLEDNIMIYDLTNTYFEGRKEGSNIARYGKSKEKRNDCKQVVLAGVVNKYGFIRHSKIYDGNMSDSKTLSDIIENLQQKTSSYNKKQTIVIDAGIATEDNLEMLRSKELKYICVSRKKLSEYNAYVTEGIVSIEDKRKNKIELKIIHPKTEKDTWMYVKSEQKRLKEKSMNQKAQERFEQELLTTKDSLNKKGGTKKYGKVMERIGRIKERNRTMHNYYDIKVEHDEKNIVTNITWKLKHVDPTDDTNNGVYFLRTNYDNIEEKQMWEIYNTIREVESTFRTLKTDLNLRPIFHQKDKYTEAHLFLGILAYQIVAVIRHQLKQSHIDYDWRNIIRIMNTQKAVTITQEAETKKIGLRLCSKPIEEVQQIYSVLNLKTYPLKLKKFVVYH